MSAKSTFKKEAKLYGLQPLKAQPGAYRFPCVTHAPWVALYESSLREEKGKFYFCVGLVVEGIRGKENIPLELALLDGGFVRRGSEVTLYADGHEDQISLAMESYVIPWLRIHSDPRRVAEYFSSVYENGISSNEMGRDPPGRWVPSHVPSTAKPVGQGALNIGESAAVFYELAGDYERAIFWFRQMYEAHIGPRIERRPDVKEDQETAAIYLARIKKLSGSLMA